MKDIIFHISKDHFDSLKITTKAIRSKIDIINCILKISEILLIKNHLPPSNNKNDIVVRIVVKKMSRVFLKYEKSIVSFYWPFIVSEDLNHIISIKNSFCEKIDAKTIKFVEFIINSVEFQDPTHTTSAHEKFEEAYLDFDFDFSIEPIHLWNMINYLLKIDHGYFRYDNDPSNTNGRKHPLDHIDFFYTNPCTFKIGLKKSFEIAHIS